MLGLDRFIHQSALGRDAMMTFLWTALLVSIVVVGVAVAVRGWLSSWARKGKSGSEFIYMALSPLFVAELLARLVGAVSGVLLAVLLDTLTVRVAVGAVGCVLLFMNALVVVGYFREWKSFKEERRVISQDEMLELIRSRAITSFSKTEDGSVSFQYVENWDENGNYLYRATSANPQGYPVYVAAANDLRRRHGHTITYHNRADAHDPLSPGRRWVTVGEATALLQAAEIKTFTYQERPERKQMPKAGDYTGITLIDHGWVRHLVVDPAMEATMIPIAREAQRRHGKPQFSSNGHYERRSPDQGHAGHPATSPKQTSPPPTSNTVDAPESR